MYNISDAYKEQIKYDVRNISYMRIRFGIVDPDAISDAVVTDNGKMDFAEEPDITDSYEVAGRYGTLEPGIWLLDGRILTKDANPDIYQSFVSDKLSGDDCVYSTAPQLTLTFQTGAFAFRGLSLNFDLLQNDYPKSLTIEGYLGGTKNFETTVEVTSAEFVYDSNVPALGDFVDKIVFTFNSSTLPQHRVRVEDVTLGVYKLLTSDVISDTNWSRSNDLMCTVLPENELSFSFYDENKDYNPDNPEGVWEYLETGQQVKFDYGYELDDGTIEWIPGGRLYTDGSPSIANGSTLPVVTFSATSKIQTLTDTYDEFVYNANGITLYDFVNNLLVWAGVVDVAGNPDFILPDSLKNYSFDGIADAKEVRELLQLAANASMLLVDVNREGKIEFKPRNTEASGFEYTFTDIMDAAPTVDKYPYLKTLTVTVVEHSVSTETTEVAKLDVVGASSTEYVIEYNAATNMTVSVTSGLTLVSTVGLYSRKAILVLTGTGTVTIKGNGLNENKYNISKQFNPVGEDCTLENIMLGSREQAIEYLDWMAEILQKRNTYTFDDRGFPEVDEADIVSLDTAFTDAKQGNVTGITVKYNGALSGNVEVLS